MDKVEAFVTAVAAWVADHKKATLVIGCLLAGAVWGLWARGLFAAPLTCDLTGSTLTCPIPAAGGGPAPTPTPTPTPVPVNDFSACPAGSVTTKTFYPQSNGSIGSVGAGKFISIRIAPSAPTTGAVSMFFSGVYGGAPQGVWAISEKACDVDSPIVDVLGSTAATAKKPAKVAYMKGYLTPNIDGRYNIGAAGTQGTTAAMEVGKIYYLNIRVDSCQAAACSFTNVKLP